MPALSLLGGILLAIPLPARPSEAVTTKYRIESSSETFVDLSGLSQPNQQSSFSLVSWIAVTVADTAGGRTVHLVIDSMRFEGSVPMLSQATADSAKGGFVHGFIGANGRVTNLSIQPDQNVLLAEFQGVVHRLFPRLQPGAKAGDTWSDSLEIPTTTAGANLVSNFRISYTAGGPETVAGILGQRVEAATSAKVSGTLENPMAGSMEVEGIASGKSSFVIAPDSRFLGGSSTSTTDQMVRLAMVATPIPVRTTQAVKVVLLP